MAAEARPGRSNPAARASSSAKVTAGVDLGGTKIQVAIVRSRKVVATARVLTPQGGVDQVVAAISGAVMTALGEASVPVRSLFGVGIGTPGQVDTGRGAVSHSPNLPGFRTADPIPLGPMVSDGLGHAPAIVSNDVRVAILGEHRRGAGRPYANVLGVFVGTGVGGGLVLKRAIVAGRGGAGEIGHTVVKDGGRRCGCGGRGHLESYAGRASIELAARRQMQRGERTILFRVMEKKGRDRLTSGVIARALEEGDRMAIRLIDQAVWALGVALSNAQNLLDLEAVIVGGGLGDRLGQPFVDRVAAAMRPRLFVPERPPAIVGTELGDLSGAVGAAVLAGG